MFGRGVLDDLIYDDNCGEVIFFGVNGFDGNIGYVGGDIINGPRGVCDDFLGVILDEERSDN